MISTSTTYNTIIADDSHYFESKIVVGTTTYDESVIMSLSRSQSMYADQYDIGNTVMNQIEFSLYGVTPSALPSMSRVEVWTRACLGSTYSEWLPMGVYYTKKPDYDTESQILSVTGYDEMWRTGTVPWAMGTTITAWDSPTLRQVAQHLADGTTVSSVIDTNFAGIGIDLEDSTQIDNTMTYPSTPFNYTVREILGEIAIACCGNWTMVFSDDGNGGQVGKLRLVTMSSMSSASVSQALGRDVTSFTKGDPIEDVTHTKVFYGYDSNGVALYEEAVAATDDGRTYETEIQTISSSTVASTIASNILSGLASSWQPFDADGTALDPALELGDKITVNSITSTLGAISCDFNQGMWASISSPAIPQEEDLFNMTTSSQMATTRAESTGAVNEAKITVNADAITAEVTYARASESSILDQVNTNAQAIADEVARAEGSEANIIESISNTISLTSENLTQLINAVSTTVENYITETNAYIRSGLLDSSTNTYGIEVGQSTDVDGTSVFNKFARFTADGIYFYLLGATDPIFWLADNQLHINNAEVLSTLKLGNYSLLTDDGLTFKYTGS